MTQLRKESRGRQAEIERTAGPSQDGPFAAHPFPNSLVLMLFAQINNLLPYLGLRMDFIERVISH